MRAPRRLLALLLALVLACPAWTLAAHLRCASGDADTVHAAHAPDHGTPGTAAGCEAPCDDDCACAAACSHLGHALPALDPTLPAAGAEPRPTPGIAQPRGALPPPTLRPPIPRLG